MKDVNLGLIARAKEGGLFRVGSSANNPKLAGLHTWILADRISPVQRSILLTTSTRFISHTWALSIDETTR